MHSTRLAPADDVRYPVRAVLEYAVYGPDLHALERFYCDVFGLEVLRRATDRLVALRCGHSTLLLFDPSVTDATGPIPEHGARGPGHFAFVIDDDERDAWRDHLTRHGIEIEREVEWDEGGTSIYVRDPAGNSVELAPPAIWNGLGRALLDSLENSPASTDRPGERHGGTP
jgi:catechol 2,3-dioxygenase-like lactoylglutathione lyase family enzyme